MTMSLNLLLLALAAAAVLFVVSLVLGLIFRRKPGKLNRQHFMEKWHTLQALCASRATWPLAVIDADKLLDEALRRRHYKGKSMGERLVSAQRDLTNNDTVWYGHKLRNKIVHEDVKLGRREVQQALKGFLQALKDLGAL